MATRCGWWPGVGMFCMCPGPKEAGAGGGTKKGVGLGGLSAAEYGNEGVARLVLLLLKLCMHGRSIKVEIYKRRKP